MKNNNKNNNNYRIFKGSSKTEIIVYNRLIHCIDILQSYNSCTFTYFYRVTYILT